MNFSRRLTCLLLTVTCLLPAAHAQGGPMPGAPRAATAAEVAAGTRRDVYVSPSTASSVGGNVTTATGILPGSHGGTGVANTGKLITLAGNLTTTGAFATTIAQGGNYTVTTGGNTTLPIASQLITIAGPTTARTVTLPDAPITVARTDAAQTFTGLQSADGFATTTSAFNAQTGTTYTLQTSDNGKIVTLSNASAITLTVPASLGAGFSCTIIQIGAGQVTVTASSTTIRNVYSNTKLVGQWAQATLTAYIADNFIFSGDTAP